MKNVTPCDLGHILFYNNGLTTYIYLYINAAQVVQSAHWTIRPHDHHLQLMQIYMRQICPVISS